MKNYPSKGGQSLDNVIDNFEYEKRKRIREYIKMYGTIDLKGTHRMIQLINMSSEGALFGIDPASAPPKKGQQLKLTITSPATNIGDMLSVMATVIHVEDHEIGVHFDEVTTG